jgi:hypothetical protein
MVLHGLLKGQLYLLPQWSSCKEKTFVMILKGLAAKMNLLTVNRQS